MSEYILIFLYSSQLVVMTGRSSLTAVNVSCLVDHTFPRPLVSLYTGHQGDQRRLQGLQETDNIMRKHCRVYRVSGFISGHSQ